MEIEVLSELLDQPEIQKQIAFLKGCMYFYASDPKTREHVAVHEAAHKFYFERLGWQVTFGGPKIIFENGEPVLTMGRVILTGDPVIGTDDWIEVAKAHVALSVVVPALTGRDDCPEAIEGDIQSLKTELRIDDVTLAFLVENATVAVLAESERESLRQNIWALAQEYIGNSNW